MATVSRADSTEIHRETLCEVLASHVLSEALREVRARSSSDRSSNHGACPEAHDHSRSQSLVCFRAQVRGLHCEET